MTTTAPARATRRPTGKPPWPTILLAGGEKSGKSWAAAEFSASTMVGRTFYIEVGEHYADEYGAIPGARYEIVEHDGTYRDILAAVEWAVAQERVDGKPNAIVFDSATVLWDMLSDAAQRTANARWRRKYPDAPEPDDEIQITMDLWNVAKGRFADVIGLLYRHDGPTILTARLEQVAVVAGGKPTTEKAWKVRAEKNLPFEVDAVIQAREPRVFQITGLRSTRFQLPVGETIPMPGFTVEGFLRNLGLDVPGATSPRQVTALQPDSEPGRAEAEAPRMVSEGQCKAIHTLLSVKRGKLTDEQKREGFSKFAGREITSTKQLTAAEASNLINALSKLPDHVEPAPAPAPAVPKQAADENRNFAEADALLALEQQRGSAAEDLEEDLRDSIESSENPAELAGSMNAVVKARDEGRISSEQFTRLAQAADLRAARGRQMAGASA